ncbi:MAG: glucokinase [Nitrospiria bacterium]
MILAGDIGGTKTTLALYADDGSPASPLHIQRLASRDFPDIFAVIDLFLSNKRIGIQKTCFGVAGPIFNQRCSTTNLPWMVDAEKIKSRYKINTVRLLNDLEATAYGTLALAQDALVLLNTETDALPRSASGNQAVIAPGTGLGEALLYWDGARYLPSPSEGGHSDFAPRNSAEIALLEYLLQKHRHVSYERVLSGAGLYAIYQFMKDGGYGDEPPWIAERLDSEDPAAVISELALTGTSELCTLALDLFISILGAEAGNLALKSLATGGIYLGGGIAPKILSRLKDGGFMKAFLHKGRFSSLLNTIPVRVILDPNTALYGAAQFAASMPAPL